MWTTTSAQGARLIPHSATRDDLTDLYVRVETLEDPGKAAALRAYVKLWARAQAWVAAHPDEWAQLYYVDHQGLSLPDALYTQRTSGEPDIPRDWSEAIALEQASVDLMAKREPPPSVRRGYLVRPPVRGRRRRGHRPGPVPSSFAGHVTGPALEESAMNALIGPIFEIAEEVPGGAIVDPRVDRSTSRAAPAPAPGLWRAGRASAGCSGPFLLLLFWSTGSAAGLIDSRVLPAPWTTAATAWQLIRDGRLPQ